LNDYLTHADFIIQYFNAKLLKFGAI